MRALHLIASSLLPLTLALTPVLGSACGDSDKAGDTTDTTDTTDTADTVDTSPTDTSTPSDTSADDTSSQADATPEDTADASEPDAADVSADTADTSSCEYFEEQEVLKCGLGYSQILHWKDFAHAECEPYYTKQGRRYATVEALAAAESCETTCVYTASIAVDFIRCGGGGRSGYTVFKAEGETCLEQIYGTDDGLMTDLCTWATYACYCEAQ